MICHNVINAIFDVIVERKNVKKFQKKFGFEWKKHSKSSIVFRVIKDNYQAILDAAKIKYDKTSIKKIIKNAFTLRRFFNKLRGDKTKQGTLATWK